MICLSGHKLEIKDVYEVAHGKCKISIDPSCRRKVETARTEFIQHLEKNSKIYGVTTGLGSLCCEKGGTPSSLHLALSHAIALGDPMPLEYVRSAILVRINTLLQGFSACRFCIIELLVELLNRNLTPLVPQFGSLSCSGDLCLLAYIVLVLSCPAEGEESVDLDVDFQGQKMKSSEAFQLAGLQKIVLESKEGLSLCNGSSFLTGVAALACYESEKMYHLLQGSYSMMMEALGAREEILNPAIHQSRNQKGQMEFATSVSLLLKDSEWVDFFGEKNVQDAYSLRCGPQVHGVFYDTLDYCQKIVTRELMAATDNPLWFGKERGMISGGNFHGAPIARVMDFLKIELADQMSMSERRQFSILNGTRNLPLMLTSLAGLHSGYMITQYTSASLLQRIWHQSFPDSVTNVTTCGNMEDHNSNGWNAALHCMDCLSHCFDIVAMEYLLATRALVIRRQLSLEWREKKMGKWTSQAFQQLEPCVSSSHQDHFLGKELENISKIIRSNAFIDSLSSISKK